MATDRLAFDKTTEEEVSRCDLNEMALFKGIILFHHFSNFF